MKTAWILLIVSLVLLLLPFRSFFRSHWRQIVPLQVGIPVGMFITGLALPSGAALGIRVVGIAFCVALVFSIWRELMDRFFPHGGRDGS